MLHVAAADVIAHVIEEPPVLVAGLGLDREAAPEVVHAIDVEARLEHNRTVLQPRLVL